VSLSRHFSKRCGAARLVLLPLFYSQSGSWPTDHKVLAINLAKGMPDVPRIRNSERTRVHACVTCVFRGENDSNGDGKRERERERERTKKKNWICKKEREVYILFLSLSLSLSVCVCVSNIQRGDNL